MSTTFDTLTALRDEWQALQPLSAENEARLWKKLRLEWNYHSNHLEGNTLTYGETELLLLHDRTTGNHSHREYLEMKAHDVGIEHVRTLAEDQTRLLTEGDIRDLNKIILKEPFWAPAMTEDGAATRTEVIPGQYKSTPNNVRLPSGQMHNYTSVEDTQPQMTELSDWLKAELKTPTMHPVACAAKLHHDFVCIHPFSDGNGRVARLLVNYVLMRSGYLPLIVRTEDKANYLTALHLADAGDLTALVGYFHQLTEWSLNLGIKAAKGESIDDPSDIEKELKIFIRNQQPHHDEVKQRSPELVRELAELGLRALVQRTTEKVRQLEPLFTSSSVEVHPTFSGTAKEAGAVLNELSYRLESNSDMVLTFRFLGYKGQAPDPFNVDTHLRLFFDAFRYHISVKNTEVLKRLYTEPLLTDEAEKLATEILAGVFLHIKKLSGTKE
ncbi:MAG: hypothetical protein RIS79_2347 [Verrucomicrobiota bacterium]|jgi:Fic family protein